MLKVVAKPVVSARAVNGSGSAVQGWEACKGIALLPVKPAPVTPILLLLGMLFSATSALAVTTPPIELKNGHTCTVAIADDLPAGVADGKLILVGGCNYTGTYTANIAPGRESEWKITAPNPNPGSFNVTVSVDNKEETVGRVAFKKQEGGEAVVSADIKAKVVMVDLDIDSDNNADQFGAPHSTPAEDEIELDEPGKYIPVNDGDADKDGVPNFADGFDRWENDGSGAGGRFTPIKVEIPEPIDLSVAKVKFTYSCSAPGEVMRSGEGNAASPHVYQPADGHLRIWKVDGSSSRRAAEVNHGGDFVRSGSEYTPSELGSGRTITLFVEGIKRSASSGDQQIKIEVKPDPSQGFVCPDTVCCTVVGAALIPDVDHNQVIDAADHKAVSTSSQFRFWLNTFTEHGDVDDDWDAPLKDGGNGADTVVNGRMDLVNFFPLWVDIGDALNIFPEGVTYRLKQANGAVNIVYTNLSTSTAGAFLTKDSETGYGKNLSKGACEAEAITVSAGGIELSQNFLDLIRADSSQGVLLVEGKTGTESPLVFEIVKDGNVVYAKEMPLKLSSVEDMYRWINIRNAAGGASTDPSNSGESANYPDNLCNGKMVVFVHGFNVPLQQARYNAAETFKRLYHSGSQAMFTAITWCGDEGMFYVPWPKMGWINLNFWGNVNHAFQSVDAFTQAFNRLPGGEKYVMAHSLGNILVSAAIQDRGLTVAKYFMLDAAVAQEAYDTTVCQWQQGNDQASWSQAKMVPNLWKEYDPRLAASNWYLLFPVTDNRSQLTWRNRFNKVSAMKNAINYFSSGEDVLRINESEDSLGSLAFREGVWIRQEQKKGAPVMELARGVNSHGGWSFNDHMTIAKNYDNWWHIGYMNGSAWDLRRPNPEETAVLISSEKLQTKPFFGWFENHLVCDATRGSALVDPTPGTSGYLLRSQLLAEAIPALSWPAGGNAVSVFGSARNVDMNGQKNGTWPEERNKPSNNPLANRWLHSDAWSIAYLYVYKVFNDIEKELK